jgi:uncharacterized membrane protein
VNRNSADARLKQHDSSQPDGASRGASPGLARSVTRLLIRGPRALSGLTARWTANLLAAAGAALLIWSAVIHLQLWGDGYRDISVIGPLFLAQGIGAIVIAAFLVPLRWLALMAAGAVTLAATAVGLLLSVHGGLFGYTESLEVPYAKTSLIVEFAGAGVLVVSAAILLTARRRVTATPAPGRSNPSLAGDRM